MNLLNYLKSLLYFFIPFLSIIFIITLLYYFDFINTNLMKYLKLITIIISCFISGLKIGKLSNNKGYLKGLILSLEIIFIFFIISLIFKNINWYQIIYYIIIILITTIASMIGINKKI